MFIPFLPNDTKNTFAWNKFSTSKKLLHCLPLLLLTHQQTTTVSTLEGSAYRERRLATQTSLTTSDTGWHPYRAWERETLPTQTSLATGYTGWHPYRERERPFLRKPHWQQVTLDGILIARERERETLPMQTSLTTGYTGWHPYRERETLPTQTSLIISLFSSIYTNCNARGNRNVIEQLK
jgi:hypothetical protein